MPLDDYGTPPWCTHRLLERVRLDRYGYRWLDAGAGAGGIIQAARAFASNVEWWAVDIQEKNRDLLIEATGDPRRVLMGDFLHPEALAALPRVDGVIMNPPYGPAEQFVRQSLEIASVVIALLRVDFCASAEREDFYKELMPDLFVLPDRPKFAHGASDYAEYAWFLWDRSVGPRRKGSWERLALTPLVERKLKAAA